MTDQTVASLPRFGIVSCGVTKVAGWSGVGGDGGTGGTTGGTTGGDGATASTSFRRSRACISFTRSASVTSVPYSVSVVIGCRSRHSSAAYHSRWWAASRNAFCAAGIVSNSPFRYSSSRA